MKLRTRKHRILAIIMGLAVLATVVVQIWRDGRRIELKRVTNIQSIKK